MSSLLQWLECLLDGSLLRMGDNGLAKRGWKTPMDSGIRSDCAKDLDCKTFASLSLFMVVINAEVFRARIANREKNKLSDRKRPCLECDDAGGGKRVDLSPLSLLHIEGKLFARTSW